MPSSDIQRQRITTATIIAALIIGIIAFSILRAPRITKPTTESLTTNTANMNQPTQPMDQQQLGIETVRQGSGPAAQNGNRVTVHYTGTLTDGTTFDSSRTRGTPFSFTLGQGSVIRGWELGLLGMQVGEQRKLTIPSDLAYGDAGRLPVIPPKSTLIFDVELLEIN